VDGELSNKQIKDKIYSTILHTSPEDQASLPGRLQGYVDMLSERLMACCDERGEVVRCDSCLEVGVILKMTRAVIEKYIPE
jgi:hypothetical protein